MQRSTALAKLCYPTVCTCKVGASAELCSTALATKRSFVRTFLQSSADAPTLHLWCGTTKLCFVVKQRTHHRRAYKAYKPKVCTSFVRALHVRTKLVRCTYFARAKLLQSWYVAPTVHHLWFVSFVRPTVMRTLLYYKAELCSTAPKVQSRCISGAL